MKINSINSTNNYPNFTGIPIAKARVNLKNYVKHYDLYELEEADNDFLEKLYNAVDLKKMMPSISEYKLRTWHFILEGATSKIGKDFGVKYNQALMIVNESKHPCGLLSYEEKPLKYYIRYFCTWPAEIGKREPFAGKTLVLSLFDKFLHRQNFRKIDTDVLRYGAFSPIEKFLSLGFGMNGGDNYVENMSISRNSVDKIFKKFCDSVQITDTINAKKENLLETLNIVY